MASDSSNSSSQTQRIEWITHSQDYFREQVIGALQLHKIQTRPETEFYLVNLLQQFVSTDRLYVQEADGSRKEEPLVFMLKEAIETPDRDAQRALFRQLGDVSLYMAGFFQERLRRKWVDLDYYIGMGGTAYQNVVVRLDDLALKPVYQELSERMGVFVEVFAELGRSAFPAQTQTDLLRVYEQWLSTGSERAAKVLKAAGIEPTAVVKKSWQ